MARAELCAQRVLVADEQRSAEDGDERDEREPDHQRGRGRGGATGVADRVLLRQPARRAAEPCGRQADDVGERTDEARRDGGEADEETEGPQPDPKHPRRRRDPFAEHSVNQSSNREGGDDEPEHERLPRRPLHDHPAFPHRCDRRDAGRPNSGPHRRDQRHERPRQHRDHRRPRLEDHRGLRHVEVDCPEERGEALREQDAEPEADGRGDDAEDGALEHDRAEHLAARGAERPQRRELLRSLRDRDRERVEDDEGADEQCDSAEGEQEVANERDELAHALSVLGGLLGAGLHHGRLRQHPLDRVEQLRLPDAVARPHGDGVEAGFPEHLPRGRDVEDRDRGAAEAVDVAEASNARERVRRAPGPRRRP